MVLEFWPARPGRHKRHGMKDHGMKDQRVWGGRGFCSGTSVGAKACSEPHTCVTVLLVLWWGMHQCKPLDTLAVYLFTPVITTRW
jgi:hypothetical protein